MAKQKKSDQLNVSSVTTQRLDPEVYQLLRKKYKNYWIINCLIILNKPLAQNYVKLNIYNSMLFVFYLTRLPYLWICFCQTYFDAVECSRLYSIVAFFAFINRSWDGFHASGSSMWVLTIIIAERVPSKDSELRKDVLFLFIMLNIHSSAALEWGIVIITSATLNSKLYWKLFMPGTLMPLKKCQRLSIGQFLYSLDAILILNNFDLRTANEVYLFEYFLKLEIYRQNILCFQNCALLYF